MSTPDAPDRGDAPGLTEADLAHIRAWHWPMQRQERDGRIVAVCKRCGTSWPCHAALLVTEVDRLCAEAAALRVFRDAIDAASLAYHTDEAASAPARFDRRVRLALKTVQDALDGADTEQGG